MKLLCKNFIWALSGEAQEMLVEAGRVVWRGTRFEGQPDAETDLGGKSLLPAFVDAHCHILPTGLDMKKLHLGVCRSEQDVLDAVRARHDGLPSGEWLLAVHYDQTRFASGGHLTRSDLDRVVSDRPVLLRHVNGHAGIANSAALAAAGIGEAEPDPPGGEFRRDASGRLDGVLLEHAHERVSAAAPTPSYEQMVEAIEAASTRFAQFGIGCASDMMTGRFDLLDELRAYRAVSEGGPVRFRLYVQWGQLLGPRAIERESALSEIRSMNPDRCRVAGVKIFADGAIGSGTAAIYGRYSSDPRGEASPDGVETSGQLIYSPDRLKAMVRTAHEEGYAIAVHSIGDRSTDLVMDVLEALGDARRHRIEHAMILSDAQIERMASIGCRCTMQPEFLVAFAHTYRRQLGPERAALLKRARSVMRAGIPLSFSSDAPIVAGDPWTGLRAISNRPEGFDPAEAVSLGDAIRAYTAGGADANGEAGAMGGLTSGHLADLQLYETNPLGGPAGLAGPAVRAESLAVAGSWA